MGSSDDVLNRVESYRKAVLLYEDLQGQINRLLKSNGGSSYRMTEADRERYRELAHRRDEAMNEMLWLENQLLENDTS